MVVARSAVVILNWRDTGHPEGGGSELYVEELAGGLARRGHDVTLVCARYPGAPAHERRADGVEVVRVGGRFSVYPRSAIAYLSGRLGHPQVVVEVQNGMPFLARLWARRSRVIVLVHHVHREQWRVVMPAAPARIGWWIESWLAPRVNRHTQYVAVSDTTRRQLVELGVPPAHIAVVHNGTPDVPPMRLGRTATPTLLAVARLVPHKRIEIAIDTLAALLPEFPDLTLVVVGRGWWEDELRRHAQRRGLTDRVIFTGYVSETEKARWLRQAWVSLVPSMKEGWGLVVVEAGVVGTPSVGFREAGGVAESIRHAFTGLLADDRDDFVAHVARLLRDAPLRERLGTNAFAYARSFSWEETVRGFVTLIDGASGATSTSKRHDFSSRAGSGLRAVVHQRGLYLRRGRLGSGIDPYAGERGKDRRHHRGQRDTHALSPNSGHDPSSTGTAPGRRSLHGGRYPRFRSAAPVQSPVVTTPAVINRPTATRSAETTAGADAANPASGSSAPFTHRAGTSYRRRSEPR